MQFSQSNKIIKTETFIIIFLYSILPISFISGNSIINSNFILIDIYFIYSLFKNKDFDYSEYKYDFFFLFTIFIYLVLNSIIQNYINNSDIFSDEGTIRSIGFLKYILFYFATCYFFSRIEYKKNYIFYAWVMVVIFILIDVYFEKIFNYNLIKNISPSNERIVSFFGDELIVGYFILGFGFISGSFLIENLIKSKLNWMIMLIFIILTITIFITGERTNFIRAFMASSLSLYFISKYIHKINFKIYIFFLLMVGIITLVISDNLRTRYFTFFNEISYAYKNTNENIFSKTKHFYNYKTGIDIFKKNKLFGVGNKKFRKACLENENYDEKTISFGCSTHPHQTYFEILSEHGIVGFIIIFTTSLLFIQKSLKLFLSSKNLILLTCVLFYTTIWIPLLPYGSFFSTASFSITAINLSLARTFFK